MRGNDEMLPTLIRSLDANARAIDQIFARAGAQLGEGLSLFETLKERLSALSGELAGGEITQAGAKLAILSGELRAIGDGLSAETGALKDLAGHSHDASLTLERLLDHMRLITILARSARIEAVSIQQTGRDFGDFTSEIVDLTTRGQRTIQDCAREHDRLASLLDTALSAQRDFQQRYGPELLALAGTLEATLAEVTARQKRGVALAGEAARHSGNIALAAGGAIIALQSGDSIRQRLEHAIAALRLLAAIEAETGETAGLDEAGRRATAMVLRRLETAQLDAAALSLGDESEAIEAALALLAGDTAGLLDLVRSLYGGDDGDSFLAALEADLGRASDLLGKCDRARSGVDRVTQTLTGVIETCHRTVDALTATVSSIVLIGMNAGLRAARVGTDGRSLVVIAQELKLAADQVATDAARLTPVFARIQLAAAALSRDERLDAAHFAALDQSMRDGLAAMRHTGDRLGTALGRLYREGGCFADVLAQARLSFSNAGAISDAIASAGHMLARSASCGMAIHEDIGAAIRELIQRRVWCTYTMAAERTIYAAVLAETGIGAQAASSMAEQPTPDEADAALF